MSDRYRPGGRSERGEPDYSDYRPQTQDNMGAPDYHVRIFQAAAPLQRSLSSSLLIFRDATDFLLKATVIANNSNRPLLTGMTTAPETGPTTRTRHKAGRLTMIIPDTMTMTLLNPGCAALEKQKTTGPTNDHLYRPFTITACY